MFTCVEHYQNGTWIHHFYIYNYVIQKCCGITHSMVLNGELYAPKCQRVVYLQVKLTSEIFVEIFIMKLVLIIQMLPTYV